MHISVHGTLMQVHTYLLAICTGGFQKIRRVQRRIPYGTETAQVPPVGRERIRPCPMTLGHEPGMAVAHPEKFKT